MSHLCLQRQVLENLRRQVVCFSYFDRNKPLTAYLAWKWGGLAPPLGDMEVEESQRRLNLVGPQVDMPQSVRNPSTTTPNSNMVWIARTHCSCNPPCGTNQASAHPLPDSGDL